ncbi:MAG: ankyrin repeat domain-containing protein [Candidatus Hydrogenedentes bacterium]|nr:ankyrin repeat domain-containing protein [Candidatus Hydrogenedentota bacterium]
MREVFWKLLSLACVLVLAGCSNASAGRKGAPTVDIGSTTLFQAAEDPSLIAKLDAIISSGANLNAKDKDGMTALHHAVAADNGDAVIMLVRAKADPAIKDAQGRTPEQVAEQEGKKKALRAFERAVG